jgi:hypothetical protein
MKVDWKKLDQLDRVVAVTSAVTVISMFLPWYGASILGINASVNGFGSGYGWLGALLIVAAGVYHVLLRSGNSVPRGTMGPGTIVLGLSAIGVLLVVIRWISLPSGGGGISGEPYSYGPRLGIYLTLIAGVVQVVIAFRLFKRSGEELPWSKR